MKCNTIAAATFCGIASVVSQDIEWDHTCYWGVKGDGSRYGTNLNNIELDQVPLFDSRANYPVDRFFRSPMNRNQALLGDVEGSLSEAQVQAARAELGFLNIGPYILSCARVKLPLDPLVPANNQTISVHVYRLQSKRIPDGGHIAYWALPSGPGLSGTSAVSSKYSDRVSCLQLTLTSQLAVMANAKRHNLGSLIYIPDFRGSGLSDAVRCYKTVFAEASSSPLDWSNAIPECIQQNEEPMLKFMSVTNAAHDVVSLIERENASSKLNIKEVRLHGFGFSTLWALRIMQIKGSLLNKVVLEGAVSKSYNFNQYELISQTAGNRLLEHCKQDDSCRQHFPDGIQSLNKLLKLNNKCTKAIRDIDLLSSSNNTISGILNLGLKYGQRFDGSGDVAIDYQAFALSIAARIIRCDDKYDDVQVIAHGVRYLTTSTPSKLMKSKYPDFERSMKYLNQVIHHIVAYTEMWNRTNTQASTTAESEVLFNAMKYKGHELDFAMLHSFQTSMFPYETDTYLVDYYPENIEADVLVIGGELDGQTPIEYGIETFNAITVAKGFHKRFAMIPAGSHIVSLDSTCGTRTVVNFLNDSSKPINECVVEDTAQVNSFKHSNADSRLSGSTDIWEGSYAGCSDLSKGRCSSPNIRACEACYAACRANLGEFQSGCECTTQLAQCLSTIGCSNQFCLDNLMYFNDIKCSSFCLTTPLPFSQPRVQSDNCSV